MSLFNGQRRLTWPSPSAMRVIGTVGSAVLARASSVITSAFSVPVILHALGASQYGLYILITGIATLLPFADLGLGMSLTSRLSQIGRPGDESRRAVSTAFALVSFSSLVLAVGFLAAYRLVDWRGLAASHSGLDRAHVAVILFGLVYLIGLPASLCQRILVGTGRGRLANVWFAGTSILSLLAYILAATMHASLAVYVVIPAALPAFTNLVTLWWLFRIDANLRPSLSNLRHVRIAHELRPGTLFAVVTAADVINFAVDPYVVAHYSRLADVGTFAVTTRLFAQPTLIIGLAAVVTMAYFGRAWAVRDVAAIRQRILTLSGSSIAAAVCLVTPLVIFSKPLVHLWTDGKIIPSDLLVVSAAVWCLLVAAQTPLLTFMNAAGFAGFRALTSGLMAIANLILAIALTPRVGMAGPLIASIIANVVFVMVPSVLFARSQLREVAPRLQVTVV